MGLWVFMLFLHVCCIVALSGGLGSIGAYGVDQFDYVLRCKFKQVPIRGKDPKVREFSFKGVFLRFCRKQKRFRTVEKHLNFCIRVPEIPVPGICPLRKSHVLNSILASGNSAGSRFLAIARAAFASSSLMEPLGSSVDS